MYSDFRFDFTAKVAGKGVSGYLLDVFPANYNEGDNGEGPLYVNNHNVMHDTRDCYYFCCIYRRCFFTCENAHQVKQDFMKCINFAVKDGGFLTCSFRDNEFGDFLLLKKRTASEMILKRAVSHCGLQLGAHCEIMPDSVWVLGPDIIIGNDGQLIDPNKSNFVWLSHLDCHSTGQPLPSVAIPVYLPLSTSGLLELVDTMSSIMRHNLHPALLALYRIKGDGITLCSADS